MRMTMDLDGKWRFERLIVGEVAGAACCAEAPLGALLCRTRIEEWFCWSFVVCRLATVLVAGRNIFVDNRFSACRW